MFGFKIGEVRKQMKILFLTIILSALSLSCTREAVNSGSKIKMTIDPSLSRSNIKGKIVVPQGYYPMHLIANIHYDGKTALEEWSCEAKDNDTMSIADCAFPPSIDFKGRQFPRGSGRIIQVMLVYGNQEERLLINYDDAMNVEFNASDIVVPIGNNWVQQGGGKIGRVGGRHGLLRSGRVGGYVVPPRTGRPPMKLFNEYIFSGWFDLMFFEDVKISYFHTSLVDGSKVALFENRNLRDIESSLTPNHAVAAYNVPTFYGVNHRMGNTNSQSFDSHKGGGESYILGFFDEKGLPRMNGSFFSLKLATAAITIDGIYRRMLGTNLLDPINSERTGFVDPDGNGPSGTESAWGSYRLQYVAGVNPTNTQQMTQTHGMAASLATTCTGVDQDNLVSPRCIQFEPTLLQNRGLIPFEGPFQAINDNGRTVYLKNSGPKEVSWRFLPGVAGNSVHGLALFILDDQLEFRGDHYPCMGLAKNAGVSSLMESPSNINVPPVIDHILKTVVSSGVQGSHDFGTMDLNQKQAVACPWVDVGGKKFFYPIAARNHGFWGGGGGGIGSNPGPVATHLEIKNRGPAVFPYLNQYSCSPLEIRTVDGSGNLASLPNDPYKVNLSVGLYASINPYGDYYLDPDCTIGATITGFELHSPITHIWFKAMYLSSDAPISIAVTPHGSEVALAPYGTFNPSVQNNDPSKILTWGPMTVFTSTCSLFEFIVADANGVPAKAGGSTIVVDLNTSPLNGGFYYDGQCGTESKSSGLIVAGKTSTQAQYKPNNEGIANIATGNDSGLSNTGLSGITAIDPGPADHAILEGPEYFTTNACTLFEIVTYKNVNGYGAVRANPPSPLNHALSFPAEFTAYQDNFNCEFLPGNTITSVAQNVGESSKVIWIKAASSGSFNLSTIVGSSPAFNSNRSFTVNELLTPMLMANTPSHDFGPVAVETSVDFTFTIQNTGTASATNIIAMTPTQPQFRYKGGNYPGDGGTCGLSLNFGDTCFIVVEFQPTAPGPSSDSIMLEYYGPAGGNSQFIQIPVQGEGSP